ncbi:MAG: Na+/H+ antiporter subunit E [Hyphomicrobiaceae bacterium]|nr:Na+/H+ antiporter subunit E [Hyphomicrobiaceae bacterium]
MMTFGYSALLFLFWILLSGHFDPLLLGLGGTSVILTVFLMRRMNILDHESFPSQIFLQLPAYFVYIFWEIVKANIDVLKQIMSLSGKPISPHMVDIDLPQKTDLGRVIYANSITLTPGTVSVELTKDKIIVHALTKDAADDLFTGNMAKAIPDRILDK